MEYRPEVLESLIGHRLSRRGFLRAATGTLGVASVALLAACGGRHTAGGQSAIVQITPDNSFFPSTVSIVQAGTVYWTNVSTDTHSIAVRPVGGGTMPIPRDLSQPPGGTPQPPSPNSGDIPTGGSWSYTFLVPGQYQFYDTNNHNLSGQITVSS